jgi:hypothetical protein
MMKSRESKMLDKVRRWRKKAYEADKTIPLPKRAKEGEAVARKLNLPLIQKHKAGSVNTSV